MLEVQVNPDFIASEVAAKPPVLEVVDGGLADENLGKPKGISLEAVGALTEKTAKLILIDLTPAQAA